MYCCVIWWIQCDSSYNFTMTLLTESNVFPFHKQFMNAMQRKITKNKANLCTLYIIYLRCAWRIHIFYEYNESWFIRNPHWYHVFFFENENSAKKISQKKKWKKISQKKLRWAKFYRKYSVKRKSQHPSELRVIFFEYNLNVIIRLF